MAPQLVQVITDAMLIVAPTIDAGGLIEKSA